MADITMPQLGETVTEGTITRWAKNVGDTVAEDEVLFEVSTDKVDSEVPSPASGVLSEILVQEGDTVDVGTKLAVLSDKGAAPAPKAEEKKEEEKEPESAEPASAKSTAAPEPEPAPAAKASAPPAQPEQAPAPSPAAASPAAAPSGAPMTEPVSRVASAASGGSKVLSPVVRRLIGEHNLDPDQIQGTGAGGRITRSDVLDVIDRMGGNGNGAQAATPPAARAAGSGESAGGATTRSAPATAAPAGAAAPAPSVATEAPAVAGERDEVVPFTNIRRRTAEHMIRSKHTSAHTMVAVEVDFSNVEKVRAAEKGQFKADEGFGLTYLPFISRATIDALREWPHLNSSVGDDQLIVHKDVNLGIAVDLDFEGLLVPVIHGADGKRLRQIAREVSGLARKARGKKLTMDDISGGTFTITNPGPFGTLMTVPVINQPQVAILSTDGVTRKPVAVELPDGSYGVAVHPVGNLVLVWDHRAVDGAYASAFVHHVKEILETRDWAAEV